MDAQGTPRPKRNIFWPTFNTLDDAKWASRQAFWAAAFVSLMTGVLAVLAISGNAFARKLHLSGWSLFDSSLFALIAVGLWKQSRVAAVAGLALYLFEQGYNIVSTRNLGLPIIAILFTFAFIAGVRGTWARRRLLKEAAPDPSLGGELRDAA